MMQDGWGSGDIKTCIVGHTSSAIFPPLPVLVVKDPQYNGQKIEDNKGVIRSCKSKDRQYNGQKFEDPKGVARSVNQRRNDNTMDRKMIKGQTTIILSVRL
jgi:hypothetical protein